MIKRNLIQQKVLEREEELSISEISYHRLFESAKDGILILDAETGMIMDVNPFLIEMLGFSKEQFIEKEIWEIGFFKDIVANHDKFLELQKKEYVRYEDLPLETVDGRKINVEFVSNVYLVNKKKVIQCNIRDITKRRQADASLRNNEARLNTLVQTIPDLIWLKDTEGAYLSCNTMFGRFIGAREADIIGKTDYDFFERELADFFRENDHKAIVAGKPTSNEEWVNYADDGHRALMDTIKTPMYDSEGTLIGVLGIGRDITERKLAEEILHDSHEDLYRLLNSMYEGAYGVDINGNCIFVNRAFLQLLGYQSGDEVIGKHMHELIHHSHEDGRLYPSRECRIYRASQSNQPINVSDEVFWCKDGTAIPVEYWSHPIEKDGVVIGSIATFIDITERKRAEEELINAKEHAEDSDKLKTAFLNNISHEIRTPFNSILGFLSMIQENDLAANERDEYFSIINKSANRLMNTINDIVEISKIQTGQIKLTINDINICKLTRELFDRFDADAKSKRLEFNIINNLPKNIEIINTDIFKLNVVLSNLIDNAIKFTKAGSIEFGIHKDIDCLLFSVKDTGIGIPKNKQQAIFERFMQADVSNTRQFEGVGLGLSISKAYVEMLGGRIWVESEEGKGSTFFFTIPCPTDPDEKTGTETVDSIDEQGNQFRT